jgi:hypothetical protein
MRERSGVRKNSTRKKTLRVTKNSLGFPSGLTGDIPLPGLRAGERLAL